MGKHEEIWAELRDLDDRVTRLEERLTAERDEALDKLDAMTAERDALRARIDGGVRVWGIARDSNEAWCNWKLETHTHTAIIIDAQPIADYLRDTTEMVEERKVKAQRFVNDKGVSQAYVDNTGTLRTDRRTTPGTRADRGES